jgi:hypothetical protein
VPDAQSAGVLVASWVAADSNAAPVVAPAPMPPSAVGPGMPGGPGAMVAPAPMVAPQPMPPVAPPQAIGPVEAAQPPSEAPVVAPAVVERSRWLGIGAMAAMSDRGGGGIRGEWDIKNRGWATFGISGSVSESGIDYYDYNYNYGWLTMVDTKVIGYLALSSDWSKWHLRGSIGLGAVYTRATSDNGYSYQQASGLFPAGELSLSIGRDITRSWGLSAGPVISLYAQEYNVESMDAYNSTYTQMRGADAMMYFALRHRL